MIIEMFYEKVMRIKYEKKNDKILLKTPAEKNA